MNAMFDGYYDYNFNNPVGRVNLLRAYDVLGNVFGLSQADLIVERAPDLTAGRRYGARLDLQFGQATATLQGNPANEPRPNLYRNIFQAYGSYIVPLGSGLNIDFGKWSSSLGAEGNYTQYQINYTRSYWFYYLPFYHMGVRLNYKLNNKVALNYWVVNGTNQTEPTNGFKDELFGLVITPNKNINWTINYYFGQDHSNANAVDTCGPVPVQPGLCFQQISPAPNGKTHIFDSYVTWQATNKLVFTLEGDYTIQRLWPNTSPGQSSAPSDVWGGAAYAKYQLPPRTYVAGRTEYLNDNGGLFTGITGYTEALKEVTATYDFTVANGFDMRWEYRRDISNRPIFLTSEQNIYSTHQDTATLGVVWWFGRKQGPW
ncbi:MAG: outer membrane beta-barrel protein [Candidatus Korobacteraceae bacterium]